MEEEKKHSLVKNILFILLILGLMAASVWVFIRCTPDGVGLVSDSVNYINGARSIVQGHGYYRESGGGTLKPITNFPPLYSMILAIPIRYGMDGFRAAWLISLIFFTLNTAAVCVLVFVGSGSHGVAILTGILFLMLRPYLNFQFYAMSEPVFFFFTFLALILCITAYRSESFIVWVLCGIACGCAFLTRYIGGVTLCAVFGMIIVFVKKKKGTSLLGLLLGGIPLIAAWLIRNRIATGSASNRNMLVHWISVDELKHGALIFWRWLYPDRYGAFETPTAWMWYGMIGASAMLLVIVIVMMIIGFVENKKLSAFAAACWTGCLYILGYFACVVLTISLFDASVNVEERIVFPAFMIGLILFMTAAGKIMKTRAWILAAPLLAFAVFLGIVFTDDTIHHVSQMGDGGYGWGWPGWAESPGMNLIRDLPENTIIYTNQPEAVSLWAGRGAFALIDPIDPSSEQKREGYDEALEEIRRQVQEENAVLVFFGIESWLDKEQGNWVNTLCDGLPVIYQDTSEWIIGELK